MVTGTCPKCGRRVIVSDTEALQLQGQLVCPQCLSAVTVDISKIKTKTNKTKVEKTTDEYVPEPKPRKEPTEKSTTQTKSDADNGIYEMRYRNCPHCGYTRLKPGLRYCPECGKQVMGRNTKRTAASPPPYRKPAKPTRQKSTTASPPQRTSQPQRNTATPNNMSNQRKKKTNGNADQMLGGKGCFWRTVIIVAIFFALYFLCGQLLEL